MSKVRLISKSEPEIKGVPKSESLISFCARVSNRKNQYNWETAPKLVKYLVSNAHWSPLEMVNVCFEIQTTRAISAQIMRHRSISFQELSQRYSDDIAVEFPELRMKGSTNRQGSSDTLAPDPLKLVAESSLNSAYNAYKLLIEQGVALETARMILPMCTETTVYANGTLRSWIHFCAQRSDEHSQKEIQQISDEIYRLLGEHYPNVIEAVDKGK